jgi:hypothetical protein
MDDQKPRHPPHIRRPKPPIVGPRGGPRRPEFTAYAIVFDDSVILRTPYNQAFVEAIKQVPAKLRAFVKDGRPVERRLREHLEQHEDYFSSHDELATAIQSLVGAVASSNGLSDSWMIALATPELFDWAVGSALQQFPDLQLYDVRVLDEAPGAP